MFFIGTLQRHEIIIRSMKLVLSLRTSIYAHKFSLFKKILTKNDFLHCSVSDLTFSLILVVVQKF